MEIGAVQKNSQEEIRVTIQGYQGADMVDLHTYWRNAERNLTRLTKKGISFNRILRQVCAYEDRVSRHRVGMIRALQFINDLGNNFSGKSVIYG